MIRNKRSLFSTAALAVAAWLIGACSAWAADPHTKQNAVESELIQERPAAGATLGRKAELEGKQAVTADTKVFAGEIVCENARASVEFATLARSKTPLPIRPKLTIATLSRSLTTQAPHLGWSAARLRE